jgi:hypothetical protein
MQSNTTADLKGICGDSTDRVFAIGTSGTILTYSGTSWVTTTLGSSTTYYNIATIPAVNTSTGAIEANFYAVGSGGAVAFYNGSTWTLSNTGSTADLQAVWGLDSSTLFTAGSLGNIFKIADATWVSMTYLFEGSVGTIWGSENSGTGRQLYLMGSEGRVHYRRDCVHISQWAKDHNSCTATDSWLADYFQVPSFADIFSSWGYPIYVRPNILLVGEKGTVYLFEPNYNKLTSFDSITENDLIGVWGLSYSTTTNDTRVFAVGHKGTIIYYDGTDWTSMVSGTQENLQAVWGASIDDFFAAGNAGTILHYDGTGWTAMQSGTTKNLRGLWGSDATNVYAIGQSGTILHYDGNSWTPMQSSTSQDLNSIYGISTDTIFAAGSGIILKYDGSIWQQIPVDKSSVFWKDVWGGPSGDFFFVGINGEILEYTAEDDDTTTTTTTPAGSTTTTTPGGSTTTTTVPGSGPAMPQDPYPADNSTNIAVTVTLQWTAEDAESQNLTFDVYLGTVQEPELAAQAISTQYYTPEGLEPNTKYYWKIVARNQRGVTTTGPLWKFTTRSGQTCLASSLIKNETILMALRNVRDNILSKTSVGRWIIGGYYGRVRGEGLRVKREG